jgi:hypothetical protein
MGNFSNTEIDPSRREGGAQGTHKHGRADIAYSKLKGQHGAFHDNKDPIGVDNSTIIRDKKQF